MVKKAERIGIGDLHVSVRAALIDAFEATGCSDLYEGDVLQYLAVIKQALETKQRRLVEAAKLVRTLHRVTQPWERDEE